MLEQELQPPVVPNSNSLKLTALGERLLSDRRLVLTRGRFILLSLAFACCFCLLACSTEFDQRQGLPVSGERLNRGEELVKGLAACGYCHGATRSPDSILKGGRLVYDRYGELFAPNITPSASGVGNWTATDLVLAIRSFRDPEGERLSKDVHDGFQWMADEDILAIFSYIASLKPVVNWVEKRRVSTIERSTVGFWESDAEVRGLVPEVPRGDHKVYGRYLVNHVARCASCHDGVTRIFGGAEPLAGGRMIRGRSSEQVAPALKGTSFKKLWPARRLRSYLSDGRRLKSGVKGRDVTLCPVDFFQNAAPRDLDAITEFLTE